MYKNPYPEHDTCEDSGVKVPNDKHIAYKRGWEDRDEEAKKDCDLCRCILERGGNK